MSEQIDWSKAPEGYPVWVEDLMRDEKSHGWHKEEDGKWIDQLGRYWKKSAAERGNCRAHYKPSWPGEGLPPVGVVCEMHYCGEWEKTEILCIGVKHVFIRQIAVTGEAFECSINLSACQFRPIRTPEQIAADEREAAIKEMTANHAKNSDALAGWAAYVYDTLGYRKP